MNMDILAIIPGRKGSKGVLNKNIQEINGKPLISYSIEAALNSKFIKRIVVSSDSEKILEIANGYNVEMGKNSKSAKKIKNPKNIESIKRPEHLSQDDSTTMDVIKHVLDTLNHEKDYFPDIIILLQPTSPLRDFNDIDEAIKIFLDEKNVDSLVSVCKFDHNPLWGFKLNNNILTPAFGEEFLKKRRQELPDLFLPNGAIFIGKTDKIIENNSFYAKKTMAFLMSSEKSLDIDTELDLKIVKCVMNHEK